MHHPGAYDDRQIIASLLRYALACLRRDRVDIVDRLQSAGWTTTHTRSNALEVLDAWIVSAAKLVKRIARQERRASDRSSSTSSSTTTSSSTVSREGE